MLSMFVLACAPRAVPVASAPREPQFWEAPPAGTPVTASGIAYQVLRPGTGSLHPTAQSTVTVHYAGYTGDGVQFDSSHRRGEPASFPLDGVIRGWTEGVQLMVEGELTRFWIPAELAYGYSGPGPVGQLVFDIELLAIKD